MADAERAPHLLVHFVGSIPLPDAEIVYRTLAEATGPYLVRLPDGETDDCASILTRILYLGLVHNKNAKGDAARLAAARRHVRVDGVATEFEIAGGDPTRPISLLAAHARAAETGSRAAQG